MLQLEARYDNSSEYLKLLENKGFNYKKELMNI